MVFRHWQWHIRKASRNAASVWPAGVSGIAVWLSAGVIAQIQSRRYSEARDKRVVLLGWFIPVTPNGLLDSCQDRRRGKEK